MYNLGKEEEQLNTVWTRINEDVPEYMKKVCEKYGMVCEKISPLETILYNRKCCLIIQIDKLHITILCVKDINGRCTRMIAVVILQCDLIMKINKV